MPARLVALDEGPDIPLDRTMVVVGRHPQCDARLDSLRVSRHHCCMTQEHGEVLVRDLGSTNGIRINGHRVEFGRLKHGDELSIAHIRYRLENGQGHEETLAAGDLSRAYAPRERARDSEGLGRDSSAFVPPSSPIPVPAAVPSPEPAAVASAPSTPSLDIDLLAVALRKALPPELARLYDIRVSRHGEPDGTPDGASDASVASPGLGVPASCGPESPAPADARRLDACRPD